MSCVQCRILSPLFSSHNCGFSSQKAKKEKDPNAPKVNILCLSPFFVPSPHRFVSSKKKRAMSAYLYYANERRPGLKGEQPNLTFGELTKTIAEEWKSMADKDKKKYNDLAAKDKERYESEKANYNPK